MTAWYLIFWECMCAHCFYILDTVNMLIFYNAVSGKIYTKMYAQTNKYFTNKCFIKTFFLQINANKITLTYTVHRVQIQGCDWVVFTCRSLQKRVWCVFLPVTYGNCHSRVGFISMPHKRAGNFSPKYLRNFHLIWNHMGIRITLDHCLPRFSPPPLFVLLSAAFAHTPLSS